jgi:hypothetical protein
MVKLREITSQPYLLNRGENGFSGVAKLSRMGS